MKSNAKHTTTPTDDTERFLAALFQDDSHRAWVTAFTQDPFAPSREPDKAQASKMSARMWAGGIYRKLARYCTDDANQYVAISTFKAAPWNDGDGVEHITPKRRKSHFERACAVMVDDIGVKQKVKPRSIKLALTAKVETSPGNCQGWYALEPQDEDSHNPELVARLIERMVEAGLAKDGVDPGMKGVTRYGRLPAGINNKPGRAPWRVRLINLFPKRVYTVREIAEAYGLDLTAPPPRPRVPPSEQADSLVTKLERAGRNPVDRGDGKWDILCPWVKGHTEKIDSGSTYFEPDEENNWAGGYKCHHGHCDGRGIADLGRWLRFHPGDVPAPAPAPKTKGMKVNSARDGLTRKNEFDDDYLMSTEYPDIPWVVDNLICPGLTLLAAPPKMGKSYFVLQMALCVGAGRPFLGRQTKEMPVSYFDLEEWAELLQKRRKRIGTAHGIVKSKVHYALEVSGGDITVQQDMQRHIDQKKVGLIILDLLARVRDELGEDHKQNAYARDYAALRTFADFILKENPGIALVIVHHTNKGNHDDWQNKISGSQGLAGATHTNMLMTNVDLRGMDDETRKEALRFRRFHVTGKAVEPDEMMLEMMDNGGGWEVSDKSTDEVKMQSKQAHILQVLREAEGRWMTAKEVKEIVEGTLDSIKRMLARMAKKGTIESAGQGGAGYRLIE